MVNSAMAVEALPISSESYGRPESSSKMLREESILNERIIIFSGQCGRALPYFGQTGETRMQTTVDTSIDRSFKNFLGIFLWRVTQDTKAGRELYIKRWSCLSTRFALSRLTASSLSSWANLPAARRCSSLNFASKLT